MKEITFELTDFCEERCKYCSSDTVIYIGSAKFLDIDVLTKFLYGKTFDRIHLSGGEPLAHPNFYQIMRECQKHTKDVVVHTNLLTHIIFNANVIDNIYVEANVSISPDVNRVNILKRVEQGRNEPDQKYIILVIGHMNVPNAINRLSFRMVQWLNPHVKKS